MQNVNKNTINYLVRFHNVQRASEACNGILITRGVQEHGMKIMYPFNFTRFDVMLDNAKKEADTAGKEMIYVILYLGNSGKTRFADLNQHAENKYVLNKAEYPRTVTAVQSLLFNDEPRYISNSKYQYQGVSNQLMFTQHGKTGDDEDETKKYKQNP